MNAKVTNLVEVRIRKQTHCAKVGHIISPAVVIEDELYSQCIKCHLVVTGRRTQAPYRAQ